MVDGERLDGFSHGSNGAKACSKNRKGREGANVASKHSENYVKERPWEQESSAARGMLK
jgi:hypothetical protein